MQEMSAVEITLWSGLLIGVLFGMTVQATGFCLNRSLRERWSQTSTAKMGAFSLAIGVAILGSQTLHAAGLVDLSTAIYLAPSFSWLLVPLGGLMFGYGMMIANGCAARTLVLFAHGNMRSFVVLLCLVIAAFATLTGVLAPWRSAIGAASTTSVPLIIEQASWIKWSVVVLVSLVTIGYGLRHANPFQHTRAFVSGVVIGLLVVFGWLVTGWLGFDEFDPKPASSLTFISPIGESIQYLMIATGMKPTFGIAVVSGVLAGSFLTAAARGQLRIEGFHQPRDILRYMSGGALMGIGGALAMGCSVGQGLTGLSTLSLHSVLAAVSILVGARLAYWRAQTRAGVDSASLAGVH